MFGTSCRKAQGFFSPFLDERIGDADRQFLRDHLACCSGCSRDFSELRAALCQARTLETIEPESDFESTVLAALPKEQDPILAKVGGAGHEPGLRSVGENLVLGDPEGRGGSRFVPAFGVGLAAAAALIVGFLLRDFVPGSWIEPPGDVARLSSGDQSKNDLGAEIKEDLASVRGSLMDHFSDSRDLFFQLATLEGQAPNKEVLLVQDELDYSRIEPKTVLLRRAVASVDLDRKSEIIDYLDTTKGLVHKLRGTVETGGPTAETVVILRHTVLNSNILKRIEDLEHSVSSVAFVSSRDRAQPGGIEFESGNNQSLTVQIHTGDLELFRRAKSLYFAKDYSGAIQIFEEFPERYPGSTFCNIAEYFRCKAAMKTGDLGRAIEGINSTQERILCGKSKVNKVSKEILHWAHSIHPVAVFGLGGKGTLEKVAELREFQANRFVERPFGETIGFSVKGKSRSAKGSFVIAVQTETEQGDQVIQLEDKRIDLKKIQEFADYYPDRLEIRVSASATPASKNAPMGFLLRTKGNGWREEDPELKKALRHFGLEDLLQVRSIQREPVKRDKRDKRDKRE